MALGITDEDVSIEPQLITPNGDGDKDFMLISIRSDKLGALRNIILFDVMGREVKRLLKNGYTGSNTFVQWDGTDETNNPLPIGHYIIWLEAIDKSGNVVHYKKKVVVGARF
jgi:flagellar hook assembly protein FlgD